MNNGTNTVEQQIISIPQDVWDPDCCANHEEESMWVAHMDCINLDNDPEWIRANLIVAPDSIRNSRTEEHKNAYDWWKSRLDSFSQSTRSNFP